VALPEPAAPQLDWFYGHGYNGGLFDFETVDGNAAAGFAARSQAQIAGPSHKILSVEWDRCVSGPPNGDKALHRGGSLHAWAVCRVHGEGSNVLFAWAVCRVHGEGSNVLFGDGHAKWLRPDVYHSNTEREENGTVIPADAQPVAEDVWRTYWDTEYEAS